MYKSIFFFFFCFYVCLVLVVILLTVVSYSPFEKLLYSTSLIILTMRFFHLLSSLTSWNDSPTLIINGHHSPPSSPLLFSFAIARCALFCFVFFVLNFLDAGTELSMDQCVGSSIHRKCIYTNVLYNIIDDEIKESHAKKKSESESLA